MFYSHEILASPQYGVATVWLVANLGHTVSSRKLNRKAIEGVDVPKACGTIEKPPGAPIALRLQGNLLYGVSGVYNKHGKYLLEDTEKTWARMQKYFRENSAADFLDPNAGKAKRNQIILLDDPSFVPDLTLPPLDFDDNGELLLPGLEFSQRSKISSQLSPLDRDHSIGTAANAPFIDLNIRRSSSQGSLGIASPFAKDNQNADHFDPMAFAEEEELPFGDFGLRIDADGNLIEEPELPPYPDFGHDGELAQKAPSVAQLPDEEEPIFFGQDEMQLPAAAPLSFDQNIIQYQDKVPLPSEEPLSSEASFQAPQRQPKQRKIKRLAPDSATHISRDEFKSWTETYSTRTDDARSFPRDVTLAQARKNAYNLTFGMGIGGIGIINGIPGVNHELAQFFAGDNLKNMVLGNIVADEEEEAEEDARGSRRRRSASVAFGSDEEGDGEDRRVRPRIEEGQQDQQDAQIVDDPMMMFGDEHDILPEIGREHPGSALSDHRRSSNAPWNRQSSVVPSSARSGKNIEAGRNAVEDSPLVGRGSIVQPPDVKFSDAGLPVLSSDGFGPLVDGAQEFSSFSEFGAAAGVSTQEANTSQFMRKALDREGQNFLGFVENVAAQRGEQDARDEDLRWVEFEGLFEAQDKTRPVVAQAFLHVLTLATKNQIKVKQDGMREQIPFEQIHIGVKRPATEEIDENEILGDAMDGIEQEVEE